jgi:hypothetical protein
MSDVLEVIGLASKVWFDLVESDLAFVDDAAATSAGAILFTVACDAASEFDRGEVADAADDGAVGFVADFGGWVEDDTDRDAVAEARSGTDDFE